MPKMITSEQRKGKVTVVGAGFYGSTTAQRLAEYDIFETVVLTDEGTPKAYANMVRSAAAKSPYAALPVSADEKHPVKLSRGMWIAVSKIIEDLGTLKDNREQFEAVVEGLRAARGLGPSEAHAEALALLGLHQADLDNWVTEAKHIHVATRDLFAHIVEQLRDQA